MEDFIEIGITEIGDGLVNLHSEDKRFRVEWPTGRTLPKSLLHYGMLDLAKWVNNEADPHHAVACYFYMD